MIPAKNGLPGKAFPGQACGGEALWGPGGEPSGTAKPAAALIFRFADNIGVRVLEAQEVEAVELKRKAKFRQTMMDSRTAMTDRLETEVDPEMKALLKEQVKHMGKVIDKAERLCLETVEEDERMNALRMGRTVSVGFHPCVPA